MRRRDRAGRCKDDRSPIPCQARRGIVTLCLLLALFGIGAAAGAHPRPHPAPCLQVDPSDESPALDYDAHTCPGVR